MKIVLFFIINFILLIGCDSKSINIIEEGVGFTLDTIVFDIPANCLSYYTGVEIDNETNKLWFYNHQLNSFDIFSLTTKLYDTTIYLEKKGPRGIPNGVEDFYVKNNQIFVSSGLFASKFDINYNNFENYMISYNDSANFSTAGGLILADLNSPSIYDFDKNHLFQRLYPLHNNRIDNPFIVSVDLNTMKYEVINKIIYPEYIAKNGKYYDQLANPNFILSNGKFIVNFPFCNNIYEYNKNGKMKTYTINTALEVKPRKRDPSMSQVDAFKNVYSSSKYLPIIFDPYKKFYYRFQCTEKKMGEVNSSRDYSMSVINESFKHLGEISLPAGILVEDVLISKHGCIFQIKSSIPSDINYLKLLILDVTI